jgi:hypothetical protein
MVLKTNDLFNFDKLKLIDKPNCPRNAAFLPLDLEGCEGFLRKLPLRAPNVDQKVPITIHDMVNILTEPHAVASFAEAEAEARETYAGTSPVEGSPSAIYDYSSTVMKKNVRSAKRNTCHIKAPGVTGHIVLPGHISFYRRDGKTFAVTEGRWLLTSYKAAWAARQIALDQDVIAPHGTQVLIIRVPPGSVGRIRDQGTEVLLDVGTHVFNSGQVVNTGTVKYVEFTHISHGTYINICNCDLDFVFLPRFIHLASFYRRIQDATISFVFRGKLLYGLISCDCREGMLTQLTLLLSVASLEKPGSKSRTATGSSRPSLAS